ncbi:multicopper oxidase family protein [Agromyces sp. H3Y2-19a]|uniref:multicopper oxidase family protein n=1 Tax=Agromyces chromiiresistens TaxID=3030835 RepID=UPI0023B8C658|nr:multicopper oxidase family protein [Agromyces chromiiresistens]MDF0512994.1 multicopper oxidase family protein [Agromyces chromiiresistens]
MSTAALLALYGIVIIAAAGLWAAAATTGARHARWFAAGGCLAVVGAAAIAAGLAVRDVAFADEKLFVGVPLALAGCVAGLAAIGRRRRADGADGADGTDDPATRIALIAAVIAVAGAAAETWIIGGPVRVVPTVVLLAVVALAIGATWAVVDRRGRRTVTGFAALAGLAVGASIGWVWLADTAPPSLEAAPGHHAVAAGASAGAGAEASVSVADLRTPADPGRRTDRFTLTAKRSLVVLDDGATIDAWTFDGQVPGPELRVREGDLVEVELRNDDIAAGVTLHWHGVDVPNGEDGVAGVTQDAVLPGDSFDYRFVADEPGTYWYHTHQGSAEGVRKGLYGMLVVEPADPPRPADGAGTLDVSAPVHTFGSHVVVGEHAHAETREVAPGTRVRVRLADTDLEPLAARLEGVPFTVVAVDGRDLAGGAEVADRSLRLPAGGRIDVEFTMPDARVALGVDRSREAGLVFLPGEGDASGPALAVAGDTASAVPMPVPSAAPELDLLSYGAPDPAAVRLAAATPDVDARLVLDRLPRFVGGAPKYAYTVDGRVFPHIDPVSVREGDLVRLTIVNRGFESHPMHVHGHHVLVLSRDGVVATGAPLRLDSVDVRPGEVWQVLLVADNPGIWMDHCHNLEHAAEGMMMTLAYEGVTSPFEHDGHGNRPE